MIRKLYAVQVKSCDDGCRETVHLYEDPEMAGFHAKAIGGEVAILEVNWFPSDIAQQWFEQHQKPAQ